MIQFVISGDLEGKAQSVCRHIVNCMHVIVRNYKQTINNMAQMLARPGGFWASEGGDERRGTGNLELRSSQLVRV